LQKKTKKILILNDTKDWYHWGCFGTSLAIHEYLKKNNFNFNTIPIYELLKFHSLPTSLEDFESKQIFFNHENNLNKKIFKLIKQADLILVNGEGSIHHGNKIALIILYICYASKKFLNKEVQIINHSSYPFEINPFKPVIRNLYKKVYSCIDYVAIREHLSLEILKNMGIQCSQSFDCLPISISKFIDETNPFEKEKENEILFAGGVNFEHAKLLSLYGVMQSLTKLNYKIKFIIGTPNKNYYASDDLSLVARLKEIDTQKICEIIDTKSFGTWLSQINKAKLLISGRFHHTIAAYCLKTPYILFESNTPKNKALSEILKSDTPIRYDDEKFDKLLNDMVMKKINSENHPSNELLPTIIEMAEKNFTFIRK